MSVRNVFDRWQLWAEVQRHLLALRCVLVSGLVSSSVFARNVQTRARDMRRDKR
jgi:hypothetical protein